MSQIEAIVDCLAQLTQDVLEQDLPSLWQTAAKSLGIPDTSLPGQAAAKPEVRSLLQRSLQQKLATTALPIERKRVILGVLWLASCLKKRVRERPERPSFIAPRDTNVISMAMGLSGDCEEGPIIIFDASTIEAAMLNPVKTLSQQNRPAAPHQTAHSRSTGSTFNSLLISECAPAQSDSIRAALPEVHTVRATTDDLLLDLSSLTQQHWLTIIIPTLKPSDANKTLQSIKSQTDQEVTVLILHANDDPQHRPLRRSHAPPMASPGQLRIVYLGCNDQGPYDAMNLGLKVATTPWVYFIGDDDQLATPTSLEEMRRAAESAPSLCPMVYGNVQIVGDGHGTYDGQLYDYEFSYEQLQSKTPCHQAIFYRRAPLQAVGGFNFGYEVCADWDANIRLWNSGVEPVFNETTVAKFSRGGISSATYDTLFFNDLPEIWAANQPSQDRI